ncbi:MAG: hypothetical protein EA379_08555 [Phycisphaerales bacterium]|nr:MAG: hypothetical protein EA379_08555 [Phycisphaerales bacterium]
MIDKVTLRLGAGLAVLALAGVMLGVLPSVRTLRSLNSDIAHIRSLFTLEEDRPAELALRAASLEEARRLTRKHTKPIPAQGDVAGLIRGLSVFLDELGVQSREVATGTPAKLGDVVAMPMSLTMTADFMSVYAVIEHVESLPRLVRVRRVRIARDRGADIGSPIIKAELMLEVLYTDDPQEEAEALALLAEEPGIVAGQGVASVGADGGADE